MIRTLALIGAGWESVRRSAAQGARADLLPRLRGLLAHADLPTAVAADAHRLAGEILLELDRYALARRHLRVAARLEPKHAPTFYSRGLAHERDPYGSDRSAARLFRIASQLEPKNPAYRAAYGRAAIRSDKTTVGVRELLAAANAAPGDLEVVGVVVSGLLEARRFEDARKVLMRGRFLARTAKAQREWNSLSDRARFEETRSAQRETTARQRQDAELATEGGRAVLPYVRLAGTTSSGAAASRTTRRDVFSLPRPHRLRLPLRRADG